MKYILLSALLLGTVLISGQVDLNFHHNMNFPVLDKNKISSSTKWSYNSHHGIHKKVTVHIRTPMELRESKSFQDIANVLETLDNNDEVVIHIAGYGGMVETVWYLANILQATPAKVITKVESGAYSGHGFLALLGDEVKMGPFSFLMLHTSSGFNYNCSDIQYSSNWYSDSPYREPTYDPDQMDRGITQREACENFYSNHFKIMNNFILSLPILTYKEKMDLVHGREVYILPEDIESRKR